MVSDDITFCAYDKCPIPNCFRHQRNIHNFNTLHSFAMFTECEFYPKSKGIEGEDVHA